MAGSKKTGSKPTRRSARPGTAAGKAKPRASTASPERGKVGADPQAAKRFAGKGDFGVPARAARRRFPEDIEDRPTDYRPGRSSAAGVRVAGVGGRAGQPGAASGGDLDADFIGLDRKGGLAQTPAEPQASGPDITTGESGTMASGPPARGEGNLPPGHVGGDKRVRGSTVDRGEDVHIGGTATGDAATAGAPVPSGGFTVRTQGPLRANKQQGAARQGAGRVQRLGRPARSQRRPAK